MLKQVSLLSCGALALVLTTVAAAEDQPTAESLMLRSHAARSTWNGFPGFSADLVVTEDGQQATGTLEVSATGEMKLDVPASHAWVRPKLKSLVGHRIVSEDGSYDVSFADEDTAHPLGRLIRINDDSQMGSEYRIAGDEIREVHRTMGGMRFAISVLAVQRNADGKHLPAVYTVSFWDAKTGALKSTSVHHEEWTRVGAWDLPAKLVAVESEGDGKRHVRQIVVKNPQLAATATAQK